MSISSTTGYTATAADIAAQIKDVLGKNTGPADVGRVQTAAVLKIAADGTRIDTAYEKVLDGIIAALGAVKKERKEMNRDMDLADARHNLSKRAGV